MNLYRLDCTQILQTRDGVTREHNWACKLTPFELGRVHGGDLNVRPEFYRGSDSVNQILKLEMG